METTTTLPDPDPDLSLRQLTAAVREAIVSGRLKPGQRLIESELAREHQVEREVVRDVIRVLAYEGLVTLTPNRGAYVCLLSDHDLRDLFAVRIALECAAAKLAARHAVPDALARARACVARLSQHVGQGAGADYTLLSGFHDAVIRASGNQVLAGLYEQIKPRFSRYQAAIAGLQDLLARAVNEQAAILDAITRHAPRAASQLMEAHLAGLLANLPPVQKILRRPG